jgi:hypothetical protein
VETDFSAWGRFNRGWAARAARGSGVAGGPERTRTTYFYETGVWNPFGSTWGAPFPPAKTCTIPEPSPTPLPSGSPGPSGPPPSGDPGPGPGNGNGNGNNP